MLESNPAPVEPKEPEETDKVQSEVTSPPYAVKVLKRAAATVETDEPNLFSDEARTTAGKKYKKSKDDFLTFLREDAAADRQATREMFEQSNMAIMAIA